MQQTLFALAALLVFSLTALSEHRSFASSEHRAVVGNLELAASDVASGYLVRALGRAYDEADVLPEAPLRLTTVGLTPTLGPEVGETLATYDDVDDFHGLALTDSMLFDGSGLRFDVAVTVRYVDPANPRTGSATPTLAKEVVVTVVERSPAGNRPPARCTLRRVVTAAEQFFRR